MTRKGFHVWVDSANGHSLRVVIQRVYSPAGFLYRLVAYGDQRTYRPVEFSSAEKLLDALHCAVPTFSANIPLPDNPAQQTKVVFSGEMELDDTQLSRLGLKAD